MENVIIDNYVKLIDNINPEETIASIIIDIVPYMETLGYGVSQETIVLLFNAIRHLDIKLYQTIYDLEYIFESFIVSSYSQHETFHKDFFNFIKNKYSIVVDNETAYEIRGFSKKSQFSQKKQELLKLEIQKKQNKIDILKEQVEREKEALVGEQSVKVYNKKYEQVQREYESIFKNSKSADILLNLDVIVSGKKAVNSEQELEDAREELRIGAKKVLKKKNAKELFELIDKQNTLLNLIKKRCRNSVKVELEQEISMLDKLKKQKVDVDKEAEQIIDKIQKELKDIQKKVVSKRHREEFGRLHNSVWSDFIGDLSMNKSFKCLSVSEKNKIRDYIRENALKFKTRMSRNIRTGARKQIDISNTCKNACKTMGIPINLSYNKPYCQKSRLVLFLDISGSCSNASEMMLTFMHEMREVFPGGCKTYVFTNCLYDVSKIFVESVDSESFVEEVLNLIPRAGAYSDYYCPLKYFYENHMSELTKDSLLFFIGDARNNKNKSGEWYLKALSRRSRKAYWLNTEAIEKWNRGDSIMSIYAPYMERTVQVTNVGELLNFLLDVR